MMLGRGGVLKSKGRLSRHDYWLKHKLPNKYLSRFPDKPVETVKTVGGITFFYNHQKVLFVAFVRKSAF